MWSLPAVPGHSSRMISSLWCRGATLIAVARGGTEQCNTEWPWPCYPVASFKGFYRCGVRTAPMILDASTSIRIQHIAIYSINPAHSNFAYRDAYARSPRNDSPRYSFFIYCTVRPRHSSEPAGLSITYCLVFTIQHSVVCN